MAKITPSPLVSVVRGKIGSVIFQRWKGINVVRNMPMSVHNPKTARQSVVRSLISNLRTSWRNLSSEQQTLWNEYAQSLSTQIPSNQIGTSQLIPALGNAMSGFNAYIGTNIRLNKCGLPFVIVPPLSSIAGPNEIDIGPRAYSSGFDVDVKFNSSDLVVGSVVRLFVKSNWPGGHSYLYSTHTVVEEDISEDPESIIMFPVTKVRAGNGELYQDVAIGFFYGKDMLFQADVVSVQGYKSPASNVIRKGITNVVPSNLSAIFLDTTTGYQNDFNNYANDIGIQGYSGAQWFSIAVVNFSIHEGESWDYESLGEIELLGMTDNLKDTVIAGYLPIVDGYEKYDTSWMP